MVKIWVVRIFFWVVFDFYYIRCKFLLPKRAVIDVIRPKSEWLRFTINH